MKGADQRTHAGKVTLRSMGFGRLFKNYYFITYLFFAVFLHIPLNTSFAFLPFLIVAVGGDSAQFGLVVGYKALLEIPVLLLMRPLRRKFPLPIALGGAAVLFAVEAYLYAHAENLNQIILIQTLNGLGGGLLIGAAANYVYSLAPQGLNSTAHTMHGAVSAIAAIFGNLMGGFLIVTFGIGIFYRILFGVLIFALCYFCASLIIGVKVLKKPLPFLKPT
jgi:MFS family permease